MPKQNCAEKKIGDKGLVDILVNTHIPFLESCIHAKQKEIGRLSCILYDRDATIDRKRKISLMKSEEMKRLRMENSQLQLEKSLLEQQVKQWDTIQNEMKEIHGEDVRDHVDDSGAINDNDIVSILSSPSQKRETQVHQEKSNDDSNGSFLEIDQTDAENFSGNSDDNNRDRSGIVEVTTLNEDVLVSNEFKSDSNSAESDKSTDIEKIHMHHLNEHNYFSKTQKVQHKCGECGYTTDRSNTLLTHQMESCSVLRKKGLLMPKTNHCKFCMKQMRHNALRSHLRHFINMLNSNRNPKGKHASISKEQFVEYLNEIKQNKKN